MKLRSGHTYSIMIPTTSTTITTTTATTTTTVASTVPTTATSTNPAALPITTAMTGLTSSSVFNLTSPTIKLLHQDPAIKKFSGEDDRYTALQFIQACEDQMVNSSITTGADKISFVRSQLTPDSLASDMMLAHAFDPKALNYDFLQFRTNFLEAFDHTHTQGSFQWIYTMSDALTKDMGNLGRMRGQSRSAQLAAEAITSLRASACIQNDQISVEHLRSLLEFQYFVMFLTPQERRVASSLDYKPGDSLLNFASKINRKLKVLPTSSQAVASVLKEFSAPTVPVTSTSASSTSARSSITNACSYCNKVGHTVERCFRRRRRAGNSFPPSSSSRSSRHDSPEALPSQSQAQASPQRSRFNRAPSRSPARTMPGQSYRAPPFSRSGQSNVHMNLQRPPFNCLIHGPSGHPTEECRAIQRMQRQFTVTAASAQSNFHPRRFNDDAG